MISMLAMNFFTYTYNIVLQCYVISAATKILGVDTRTSLTPDNLKPQNISSRSVDERKAILNSYCRAIVAGFTNLNLNNSNTVFSYDDRGLGYAIELLTLGLLYVKFTDAGREGDGERVHRCWKFMFPLFKESGRTNYTIEAFTMLYSHAFLFSPRQADKLLWCHFVNTTGRPGKNIALNCVCNDIIHGLGANKSPKDIQRIGKCIGVLKSVADNFDEQTGMNESKGYHTVASVDKDRDVIINELLSHSIFSPLPGRSHSSFKNIDCSVFSKVNYGLMLQWMKEHIPRCA